MPLALWEVNVSLYKAGPALLPESGKCAVEISRYLFVDPRNIQIEVVDLSPNATKSSAILLA
jgi:hypothetical protein